jgi:hypothetical protein
MATTTVKTTNVIKASGSPTSDDVMTTLDVDIQAIRWVGATTNAHLLTLYDTAGNTVFAAEMATANLLSDISQVFPRGLRCSGLKCHALDSGTVYIYL